MLGDIERIMLRTLFDLLNIRCYDSLTFATMIVILLRVLKKYVIFSPGLESILSLIQPVKQFQPGQSVLKIHIVSIQIIKVPSKLLS